MRKINKIIIHCSDSDYEHHDDIEVIDQWHRERGFNMVGYHYFIQGDGNIQKGRDVKTVGAHCKGHNYDSIGICLHGKTKFTDEQFINLTSLINQLLVDQELILDDVYPHNHYDDEKTCPNFDLNEFKENYFL